jgi:hypothetical protein
MSILNFFNFKLNYNYPLLLINIFNKRKLQFVVEEDNAIDLTKSTKKVKMNKNNDLYNKLTTKLSDNNDIKVVDEFNDLVINFKNPSFGFSIRIKKNNDYFKTELMISQKSCYSSQLGYDEPYHIHHSIESVIDDIYNVFERILKLKSTNTKWINFTFVLENKNSF